MEFADRLRALRRKRKLSQEKFGKLIGIHYTQISRYERGVAHPSYEALGKMAEVLGVTTDYLREGKLQSTDGPSVYDPELIEMLTSIEKLEEEDKRVVKIFLKAFLNQKKLQELVG